MRDRLLEWLQSPVTDEPTSEQLLSCQKAKLWLQAQPEEATIYELIVSCPRGDWLAWAAARAKVDVRELALAARRAVVRTAGHVAYHVTTLRDTFDEGDSRNVSTTAQCGRLGILQELLHQTGGGSSTLKYAKTEAKGVRDVVAAAVELRVGSLAEHAWVSTGELFWAICFCDDPEVYGTACFSRALSSAANAAAGLHLDDIHRNKQRLARYSSSVVDGATCRFDHEQLESANDIRRQLPNLYMSIEAAIESYTKQQNVKEVTS